MINNNLFPVVILAGGLATRLRPLTDLMPKVLLEINNEPFISHQLKLLQQHGVRQVVICLGYLGEMVQEFVGDGLRFDMDVQYSYDGDILLGTGGAIKKALPLLKDNFFVLYGDSYLPCDYFAAQNFFLAQKKLGLMTVFHNLGQWDTSNVEYIANEIKVYDKTNRTEKMQYIDYGLGVFNKNAFAEVPVGQAYDLAALYRLLLNQKQLAGMEIKERFYEIGSFAGIEELGHHLLHHT